MIPRGKLGVSSCSRIPFSEEMDDKHKAGPRLPISKSAVQSCGKLPKFAYHEYSIGNRDTIHHPGAEESEPHLGSL